MQRTKIGDLKNTWRNPFSMSSFSNQKTAQIKQTSTSIQSRQSAFSQAPEGIPQALLKNFGIQNLQNRGMNFKELQGVSKLSCVDVSDVKKKIEESKNTEICKVPNSQAQTGLNQGQKQNFIQTYRNQTKTFARPAPNNLDKFRGMAAKPKSQSQAVQPQQTQGNSNSAQQQQQQNSNGLNQEQTVQNDIESRRNRNKILKEETFGVVDKDNEFFNNEEAKAKHNQSQTSASSTAVANTSQTAQSTSLSKSSTKQKQAYQPQPQTKPSVVQQLLNQAPQTNKVKKTKEQLKYEKYEQRQAAKQQQQQQQQQQQTNNKTQQSNQCACCKGQLNQSQPNHTCPPSVNQVKDKVAQQQSTLKSIELDPQNYKMGGKPYKEGDDKKPKNYVLLNRLKERQTQIKPITNSSKMILTGTALDAIYLKLYYLGKSYTRSMNFFEQQFLRFNKEKDQYVDFNLYPQTTMSRTSEGDSDAEEYNWEARMNETFKKDDLLRACKSILEDAKLKAGNQSQELDEEQKDQLSNLKKQFIEAIKSSSSIRDAVNKKLQEFNSDFRLPTSIPKENQVPKKQIWKDVVDQQEIRNIIKSIWNMSISTQVVDGEIMSGSVHFQEKSKVRSHSEDYEEDAIQQHQQTELQLVNFPREKLEQEGLQQNQVQSSAMGQSWSSQSSHELNMMKINIKLMFLEENMDQDLREFSSTWLQLYNDLETGMLKFLQPTDSSVLFSNFTHVYKVIMGENPSLKHLSEQYLGEQKPLILQSLVDWLKEIIYLQYQSIQQVFFLANKRYFLLQNLEPVKNLQNRLRSDENLAADFRKYRKKLKDMRQKQPRFLGRSWLPIDWKVWKKELDILIKAEIAQLKAKQATQIQVPHKHQVEEIEDPESIQKYDEAFNQAKSSITLQQQQQVNDIRKFLEKELLLVQDLLPQGAQGDTNQILEDVAKSLDQIKMHQLEMNADSYSQSMDNNCDEFILRVPQIELSELEHDGKVLQMQIGKRIPNYVISKAPRKFTSKFKTATQPAITTEKPSEEKEYQLPNFADRSVYHRCEGLPVDEELELIKMGIAEDGKRLSLEQLRDQIDKGFSVETRKCSDCDKVLYDRSSCFILMQQNKVVCSKCILNEIYTKTESCDYLVEKVWTKVSNIMKLRQKINGAIRFQQIADWRKQNSGAEKIDEKALAKIQSDYQAVAEGKETDEEKVQRINLFFDLLQIELEKLRRSALKQHVFTKGDKMLGVQPPNFESLRYQMILKNLSEKFKQFEETGNLVKQKLKQAHVQAQTQAQAQFTAQAKQQIANIYQQLKGSQPQGQQQMQTQSNAQQQRQQQQAQQQQQQTMLSQHQQIVNNNNSNIGDKKSAAVANKGQSMSSYLGLDIGKSRVLPKPMQYERTDSTSRSKPNTQQMTQMQPMKGEVKWPPVNQTPAEQLRQQMETFQKLILDQSKRETKAAQGVDPSHPNYAEEQKLSAQLSSQISMITSTVQSLQAQSRDGKHPNLINSQIDQTLDQLKYIQEEAQKIKGQYMKVNPFNGVKTNTAPIQAPQQVVPSSRMIGKSPNEQIPPPNPMLFQFPSADLPLSRQAPPSDSIQPSSGHISGGVQAPVQNPPQAATGVTATIKKNKNKKKNNKKKASASKTQVAGNPSTQ